MDYYFIHKELSQQIQNIYDEKTNLLIFGLQLNLQDLCCLFQLLELMDGFSFLRPLQVKCHMKKQQKEEMFSTENNRRLFRLKSKLENWKLLLLTCEWQSHQERSFYTAVSLLLSISLWQQHHHTKPTNHVCKVKQQL